MYHSSAMVGGTKSADADERFQHITTDPRFRTLRRSQQKVKADSRWRSMMKDERFTHKATTVDKRGRPKYTSMKEDYRRLFLIVICRCLVIGLEFKQSS